MRLQLSMTTFQKDIPSVTSDFHPCACGMHVHVIFLEFQKFQSCKINDLPPCVVYACCCCPVAAALWVVRWIERNWYRANNSSSITWRSKRQAAFIHIGILPVRSAMPTSVRVPTSLQVFVFLCSYKCSCYNDFIYIQNYKYEKWLISFIHSFIGYFRGYFFTS